MGLVKTHALPTRIIARLDVKKPNVVKGIHLEGLRIVGSPGELVGKYQSEGIDELVFIDSVASLYQRNTVFDVISDVAERIRIPFTVGGGIKSIDDISKLLYCGADKVLINTGAVENPSLLTKAANKFGSQCVVLSIEAKKVSDDNWVVYVDNGRENTQLDVIDWVEKVEELGVGEIFLTSIDKDGTRSGFDIELCRKVIESCKMPVVVSGGAGELVHIEEVIVNCNPSGIGLGAMLHYEIYNIDKIKGYLQSKGIFVRPVS